MTDHTGPYYGVYPPPPARRPAVPEGGVYRSASAGNVTQNLTDVTRKALNMGPNLNPAAAVPAPTPEGVAEWHEVAEWARDADRIATVDPSGVMWCAAGGRCLFPRWQRYNPAYPGDLTRPVTVMFVWLAEHWGCPRG